MHQSRVPVRPSAGKPRSATQELPSIWTKSNPRHLCLRHGGVCIDTTRQGAVVIKIPHGRTPTTESVNKGDVGNHVPDRNFHDDVQPVPVLHARDERQRPSPRPSPSCIELLELSSQQLDFLSSSHNHSIPPDSLCYHAMGGGATNSMCTKCNSTSFLVMRLGPKTSGCVMSVIVKSTVASCEVSECAATLHRFNEQNM